MNNLSHILLFVCFLLQSIFLDATSRARKEQRERKKNKTYIAFEKKTEAELIERKDELVTKEDYNLAIKYLTRLLKTSKNQERRVIYLLELADCYFEYGDYKKAEFTYGEFKNLYAGHDAVAYSAYREILSAWKGTSDPDRDQTQTEKTLLLSNEFLKRPTFAKYHDVVGRVQTMCYEKLVESELRICKFYKDKGQEKAVKIRIAHMQEKWGNGFLQLAEHIAIFEKDGITQLCLAHNTTSTAKKVDMVTRF